MKPLGALGAGVGLLCSACAGLQSALAPAGPEAADVLELTRVLAFGSGVILLLVLLALLLALRGPAGWRARFASRRCVLLLGLVLPVGVLSALLGYGFLVLRAGATRVEAAAPLRIRVIGRQWWWQVVYRHDDGRETVSANEIRIPTGRTIALTLESADVIHSFWVPAYAGKVDMIPGRSNLLHLRADRPGVVRGQCAEYCGGAHAWMAFYMVALPPDAFARWLAQERADTPPSREPDGERLFLASGCGGCHRIRGTPADGSIGPDLTHVGGRLSIGAGVLPADANAFARWIARHPQIKPGTGMPPFEIHGEVELAALGRYLAERK